MARAMTRPSDPEREVSRAVARLQAGILALVFGVIGGLTLFILTAWLLIKGGINVGEHLQLLRHYLPGYSVTWTGAFVGLLWGGLLGGLAGWAVGMIYNLMIRVRFR